MKNVDLRLKAQYGDYFDDTNEVVWDRDVTFYQIPKMVKGTPER